MVFPEDEVLALPLEEALRVLEKAGLKVEMLRTGPPRELPGQGEERVVRVLLRGNTAIVTAAREMAV